MGATIITIATAATVIAAGALVLTGIYYGVKCIVHIIREGFTTKVETSGKGNDMAKVAEGLNNDLKSHNIKRNEKEEADLQKTINEIRNDSEHVYKVSTKIEREDGEFIHTEEEKGSLDEINVKFQKCFTHKDEIIYLCDYNNEFGDFYLEKFSKVGWEKLIELKLNNNNITKLEPLYNMQFLFLEKLDLSYNNISDIDDINKLQILNLKVIYLNNNEIDDPFAFYDEKFNSLEYLNLLENKIEERDKEKFKNKYTSKHKDISNLTLEL
jgi:Leucine-rich repeat (LRR) protein